MAFAGDESEIREIEWVEIAGMRVAAEKVVCPECRVLWLDAEFDTSNPVEFKAMCPEGHVWTVEL